MATEDNDDFIPPVSDELDAFPTKEALADTKRPDPLDFDEPDSSYFNVVEPEKPSQKSGAPDKQVVDESDSGVQQELAESARNLGMNEDEIASIKDTGALRSIVAALQRQATRETDAEKEPGRKPDAGESPSSEYEALSSLDPEDSIDPSAVRAIKALKAELDKLRSKSDESGSRGVRIEEADYLIAKLGDDFVDLFGDGPSSSFSPKSEQYKARATVVEEMQRIRENAKNSKKRIPDTREAFDQAVRSVFGSHVQKAERKQLSSKIKQRESQLIARPVNNGRRATSGRERAIESVAAMMRERMNGSGN